MLLVVFLLSLLADAVGRPLDPKAGQGGEGVVAVVAPADLRAQPLAPQLAGDGFRPTAWPALASEPRFCGEAVAAGRAPPPHAAAPRAQRVRAAHDRRPARVTPRQGPRDDPGSFPPPPPPAAAAG